MISKLLGKLFLLIASREAFILLVLGIAVAGIPMGLEHLHFLRETWGKQASSTVLNDMEHLVNTFACILVAAGVLIESRVTLRGMALRGGHHVASFEEKGIQDRLNDVAHQNGMGLLLVGLFQEIGTLLTALPERIVHSRGFEKPVFWTCAALSVVAYLVMFDFVKDYIITYFKKDADYLPKGEHA